MPICARCGEDTDPADMVDCPHNVRHPPPYRGRVCAECADDIEDWINDPSNEPPPVRTGDARLDGYAKRAG